MFFPQSVLIVPATPQAVWLSIHFIEKSVLLQLFEGLDAPLIRFRKEEKSPAPGATQTHNPNVTKCALYHCASTAAQELKALDSKHLG